MPAMPIQNPNPNNKQKRRHGNYDGEGGEDDVVQEKQVTEFEFCKVCKLSHNKGRRHNYFPNHKKALSSFLSRFRSKLLNDVAFYLKNPMPLRPEHAALNRLWCVFCDSDVLEFRSSFACANAIAHLASAEHLKEVKNFLWKYGGGMDRVDSFRISDSDFAKWEKKCKLLTTEAAAGEECHGSLNDIHNETKLAYVNSSDKNKKDTFSFDVQFPDNVVPLQDHTNERSQISHSEISGAGSRMHHTYAGTDFGIGTPSSLPGLFGDQHFTQPVPMEFQAYNYHHNGNVYPHESITTGYRSSQGASSGESSSWSGLNLTQIPSAQEETGGNVHSGAPPPWLSATETIQRDNEYKQELSGLVSSLCEPVKSSKLNPKRVGAAWAERRKRELELEKRGELVRHNFDADWLPNFGRVWQSGSRKESRKEFLGENMAWLKVNNQMDKPRLASQLQPYISKRMRSNGSE